MKPARADAEVEEIAREIERYASLHPTAADTLDGIARWWLDRQQQPALNHVETALELLVRRGVLVRRKLPDCKSIYACRPPAGSQRPSKQE